MHEDVRKYFDRFDKFSWHSRFALSALMMLRSLINWKWLHKQDIAVYALEDKDEN